MGCSNSLLKFSEGNVQLLKERRKEGKEGVRKKGRKEENSLSQQILFGQPDENKLLYGPYGICDNDPDLLSSTKAARQK